MILFTQAQHRQLLENGHNPDRHHMPVVKLYLPFTSCVWLLSELDPAEPDLAFGLCDLGMGCPELGSVWLPELAALNIADITVCRDEHFQPAHPMSVYAEAARCNQAITDDHFALLRAKEALRLR